MKLYRLLPFLTLLFVCASTTAMSGDDASRIVSSSTIGKEVRQFEVTGPWGGDVRALVAAMEQRDKRFV